jgi:nicotinate-nucleotide pyrophosphorylase (carboxylating)
MNDQSPDLPGESRMHALVEEALLEDLGMGDVTTDAVVDTDAQGKGEFLVKEQGVLAGLGVAGLVFQSVDPSIHFRPLGADGEAVATGKIVAMVHGPLQGILKAERTALNFLQRMSGIATLTWKFVEAVEGTGAKITDTRKTAPGLRLFDKLAVRMGGGVNHRFGLDDMAMIKDNHIAAAGGLTAAVRRYAERSGARSRHVRLEVETKNLDEVREALALEGIHRIMLDNFPVEEMRAAVALISRRAEVEASGNVSLLTVRAIAETGVDFISVGALTHSPKALDVSLEILPLAPTAGRDS